MNALRTIIATALLMLATSALAQTYAFAGVGVAHINTELGSASNGTLTLGLGYRVSQMFALEAAFSDYGSSSIYSGSRSNPNSTSIDGGSSLGISAVNSWQISGPTSILAKLGVQHLGGHWSGTRAAPTSRDIGWIISVGLGAQVELGGRYALRAMFEQLDGREGLERVRLVTVGTMVAF